jgi:hypothetical protein
LITVKRESNQIEIKEFPTVPGSSNKEQRKTYEDLTGILFKYTTINEGKKVNQRELNDAMDKMHLTQE